MRKGDIMDVLEEAKELMKKAGCEKAFAVYGLELCNIAEVRNCNRTEESIELEKKIDQLVPSIKRELVIDQEEPIECPLDSSMSKYLEFSLKSRSITPYNISHDECVRIEQEMKPLLEKYNWSIKKKIKNRGYTDEK
jgi:hypothetical protein